MGQKGESTRREIISKSLKLFSVKGFHNTSINDILKETGLTKGGIYGHFDNKEEIWNAAYGEAVSVWRKIIFKNMRSVSDPLQRIEILIEHDMRDYLGSNVFPGGCFFLNMLVDLSGQSPEMSDFVWSGFESTMRMLEIWLEEADQLGLLKPGSDYKDISKFIVITLNGTAALYAATKDPSLWQTTIRQLKCYLDQLRK